jgi:Zn-dependent protease with chaperone function
MSALARRAGGVLAWLGAVAAVAAHAAVAVLAAAEVAAVGWPLPTSYDSVNVVIVLAAVITGAAASGTIAARAAAGSRALRALIRSARRPVPAAVRDAAAGLGLAGRVDAVDGGEAFAVTYGLIRPRILVSTALADELTAAEVAAVLAHEREHVWRRDPLRLLAARLLAAWAWYLPAARWLSGRAALRRELAADRASARWAGRGVLAGALLKLASPPACQAVAAASPAPDEPGSLEARVAQLEGGRPPRPRLSLVRGLATAGSLVVLAAAATCCAALSQLLPGGAGGIV